LAWSSKAAGIWKLTMGAAITNWCGTAGVRTPLQQMRSNNGLEFPERKKRAYPVLLPLHVAALYHESRPRRTNTELEERRPVTLFRLFSRRVLALPGWHGRRNPKPEVTETESNIFRCILHASRKIREKKATKSRAVPCSGQCTCFVVESAFMHADMSHSRSSPSQRYSCFCCAFLEECPPSLTREPEGIPWHHSGGTGSTMRSPRIGGCEMRGSRGRFRASLTRARWRCRSPRREKKGRDHGLQGLD
jgi:hypothetical protein